MSADRISSTHFVLGHARHVLSRTLCPRKGNYLVAKDLMITTEMKIVLVLALQTFDFESAYEELDQTGTDCGSEYGEWRKSLPGGACAT